MVEVVVAIARLAGLIIFQYFGWVPIVGFLGYSIWQNRRHTKWVEDSEHTLLIIEVPKENEKKELSAEQMFASLHGILRPKSDLDKDGALQEHISLEIAAIGNQIWFYVWTPKHLRDFVEGQIYAQYPNVLIREASEDYTAKEVGERIMEGAELVLTKSEVLPIKTFVSFEVDPLAGITAVLSKLEQSGEEMWIQILARPVDDSWQDKGQRYIEEIKGGKKLSLTKQLTSALLALPIHVGANFLNGLWAPPEAPKGAEKKEEKLSTAQSTQVKAIEEKIAKLGYTTQIRIVYLGPDATQGRMRLQALVGAFKQFNTTNLNGYNITKTTSSPDFLTEYRARLFDGSGQTLNIEELASLYHLPHKSVETPNLVWASTKTSEPPANLPTEGTVEATDVSLFGLTNYRGQRLRFGIKREDRGRHLYIIGQTGTGKSFLLQLLALSDLYQNQGIAVVDPHGDLVNDIMKYIPADRIDDVVYFNPTDRDFPIAFNPMEVTDPAMKHDIASELVGVMKRMFESWGPRLEHILRFTILALLDYPDATMLGITRMLTEKEFRKKVVKEIQDPVVKGFWVNEFAGWNDKFANEAVAPVLNKVGAFIANPLIRNVIGQPHSTINFRKIMDEGKILLVNLSHGQIGEINAGILGSLIVTSIQLAAMSRANVAREERRPFYLYVDEFQNFSTDSFAVILSEARKYSLNLTVANQFIAQMPETVREAVFGNVGSMISFRCGAGDSTFLGKYFEPSFEATDLVKLNNQHVFINMSINGEKVLPFSATTLKMPAPGQDHSEQIIEVSRRRYATSRDEIEDKIKRWTLGGEEAPMESTSENTESEQKPNEFIAGLHNPSHSNSNHQPNRRPEPARTEPKRHDQPAGKVAAGRSELAAGQEVKLH